MHDILIRKLSRFIITGVCSTAIYFGSIVFLVEIAGLSPVTATVLGQVVAFAFSYTVQTLWTFKGVMTKSNSFKFIAVNMAILLIAFVTAKAMALLGVYYIYSTAVVIVLATSTSFVLHNYWTYRE